MYQWYKPINWELPQINGTNWKSSSPQTPWLPAGSILYVDWSLLISSKYLEGEKRIIIKLN